MKKISAIIFNNNPAAWSCGKFWQPFVVDDIYAVNFLIVAGVVD
ncbi:MAG: hypothetical protein NT118_03460 [Lentisphaerae bacterium]|nr:hypothetical protein [Lentisphaerota bacterium]